LIPSWIENVTLAVRQVIWPEIVQIQLMIDEEVVAVDAALAVVTVAVSTVERQVTWPVSVLQQTVEEVVVGDLGVIKDLEVTGPAITVAKLVTSLGIALSPVKVELVVEEAGPVPVITVAVKDTCLVNALTDALADLEAQEEEVAVVAVTATTVAMMVTLLAIVKLPDRKEEVVVVVVIEETATATDVDNQAMSEMTVLLMKARSRSLSHLYLSILLLSLNYIKKIRVFCLVTVILINLIPRYEFN